MNSLLCIGIVKAAHGVKGEVKLTSYTDPSNKIATYENIFDKDVKPFPVSISSINKNIAIATLDGITDRNAAEKIVGTELFIHRSDLPEIENDEFYHADLKGLFVKRMNGDDFGVVSAVNNFGAGDIIEITLTESGKEVMFPFDKKTFPEIDIEGGFITINPPEEIRHNY